MFSASMFLDALRGASTFEESASVVGRACLNRLPTALRAVVHLRGQEGYRGLFVEGVSADDLAPSATTWRWIQAYPTALLVDLVRREVRSASGEVMATPGDDRRDFRSADQLMRRAHGSLVLPLRGLRSTLAGHIAIELANVPQALVTEAADLLLCADLATPFLDRLPRRAESVPPDAWLPIIGQRMQPIMRDLRLFAPSDLTVLFLGESGVGKSRMASWLHHHSGRRGKLVRVNLATEPENLRSGALFGWKKGAFTGATDHRRGPIEEAEGGTLFIDEVDKLPVDAQAMLLDLLDDGTWHPLGETQVRHADVRMVVGTNADLRREVNAGRFLPDLLYRMNEVPILLPPLRERRDEVPGWANHFASEKAKRRGQRAQLTPAAAETLGRADWPGNLRGLETMVGRALALAVEQGTAEILIDERHVDRAMAYDLPGADALIEALEKAAELFVNEAQKARVTLKNAHAFPGFVLEVAVRRFGERAAFEALGEGHRLSGSNHKKALRVELERSEALRQIFRGS